MDSPRAFSRLQLSVHSKPVPRVASLRAHRVRQLKERLIAGPRWQERGLVFPSTNATGYIHA